jgi:hypothetical protein
MFETSIYSKKAFMLLVDSCKLSSYNICKEKKNISRLDVFFSFLDVSMTIHSFVFVNFIHSYDNTLLTILFSLIITNKS